MQRLRIDLESTTVAPTAYLIPRVMLYDDADPSALTDVTDSVTMTATTGNVVIHDSAQLGIPVIYGYSDGVDTVTAVTGMLSDSVQITVDSDWDYGLKPIIPIEAASREFFDTPWAKVNGYDKGRKRVVADPEQDEQTDVITSLEGDVNEPASISLSPATLIVPQTFDIRVFKTSRSSGYGKWYGYAYGVVEEVNEVWD